MLQQFLEAHKITQRKDPLHEANSIKLNTDLGYQKHIKD